MGNVTTTAIRRVFKLIDVATGQFRALPDASSDLSALQQLAAVLRQQEGALGITDIRGRPFPPLRNAIKTALAAGVITADTEIDPFSPGLPLSDQTQAAYWNANDHIHPNTDAGRLLGMFISERLSALTIGA